MRGQLFRIMIRNDGQMIINEQVNLYELTM